VSSCSPIASTLLNHPSFSQTICVIARLDRDRRCRQNINVPPDMVTVGSMVTDGSADGFTYQSTSGGQDELVAFGGYLRFVPGTLREPTGEPFDVKVEHFTLDSSPEYVY
jgi:hypothetical protein